MKDKEKQIEEMARIIAFDLCPYGKLHAKLYENRAKCASNDNFAECTKINKVVEKLYEQGYRKLPEDSVVLSREKLQEHDKKLANDIITMFQKLAQNWASADIVNDTAKRLRKLYEV